MFTGSCQILVFFDEAPIKTITTSQFSLVLFGFHLLCPPLFISRESAVSSVPSKLSAFFAWVEWPENWTTILSMVLPCWFFWSASLVSQGTGWPASGTALETMRWLMRTATAWGQTAGCSCLLNLSGRRTSSTLQGQVAGRVDPARTPSTSHHCISPWPAWPASALGTSHQTRTERRSLLWQWWWSAVSSFNCRSFWCRDATSHMCLNACFQPGCCLESLQQRLHHRMSSNTSVNYTNLTSKHLYFHQLPHMSHVSPHLANDIRYD